MGNKKFHWYMMVINAVFVVTNGALMYVVETPYINLICALISLAGFVASYIMYESVE